MSDISPLRTISLFPHKDLSPSSLIYISNAMFQIKETRPSLPPSVSITKIRDLPIFFSTFVASIAAGAWRLVLMPIDTSKTVLQVEGNEGYRSLMRRISRGEFSAFYQGALATAAAAAFGHFPWFYVYGVLDEALRAPVGVLGKLCRNAFIGFMASAVSDALTNVIRVIKTTKQATASLSSISYMQTVQIILAADGWKGLFGRGLSTRILTNGRVREGDGGKQG